MILVLLIIVVFGERIVHGLTGALPNIHYLFDFLRRFRVLYVIALLALFFCAVFTWMPNRKNNFFMELPGALFVGVAWYLASWVFSIYVNHFFAYSMYGSLATVTIVMLWLYMCFYIVMIGALLNQFLKPFNLFLAHSLMRRRKIRKSRADKI
jgi:membrane protein